jgi:polyhydroxyalkanoate synthesis regulator phasin
MFNNIGDDLKKIVLAGIGAVAATTEKSKQMLDELVKKGELTVEQGKILNEELKRNIQTKTKEHDSNTAVPSIADQLDKLSKAEIEAIKAKLAELEVKDINGENHE